MAIVSAGDVVAVELGGHGQHGEQHRPHPVSLESQMIMWNVEPGTYAMFCPVPRPASGPLNAADGMVRIVRLR